MTSNYFADHATLAAVDQNDRLAQRRTRWSSRIGFARSATSTRSSTPWSASSCGRGCGRWPADSRRSRRRATSSSTRSSISRSSSSAPRTAGVRAFQNACRHRGVKLVDGRGTCACGFVCPFHGWCYDLSGANTFVPRRGTFAEHNLQPGDIDLRAGAVRGLGRVRVDQPRRRRATAARLHRARGHDARRLEGRVDASRVVARLPPAGELEARPRGVHGAVPRARDAPPAADPWPVPAATARCSTRGSSSSRSSTTSAR